MPASVTAERVVARPPAEVYGFLSRLENHWHLGDRWLRLEGLSADRAGGRVVIAAPLGLRRTARTRVHTATRFRRLGGTAAVGARTHAHVDWHIADHPAGARVRLHAEVVQLGDLDAWLLRLGGHWWLRRRFAGVLTRLAEAVERPAALAAQPAPAPVRA